MHREVESKKFKKFPTSQIARFKLDKKDIGLKDRLWLLLISDTHVTPSGSNFNRNAFLEGIKQVNSLPGVDFVLHLGDITDSGTEADYLYYQEMINALAPEMREKCVYIPGNHDVKNVGDRLYEEYISEKRNFTLELPGDSVIIGLDSTEPDENTGEIGFKTTKFFKKILSSYSGLKIVCFHHQLVPIPKTGRERSAITDAGNVLEMLLDVNVNLVLNGHRHITNLYNMTDGDGELLIFNAGTFSCSKTRFHELWTYTLLEIEHEDVTFTINSVLDASMRRMISRPFFAGVKYDASSLKGKKPLICLVHMANTAFSERGGHDHDAWTRATRKINQLDCDLVVHSGNVISSHFKEDFRAARDFLEEIEKPLMVIPGVQETRYPMSWEYFKRYIGDLDPMHESDKLLMMGVNSCQLGTKSGIIGRRVMNETLERVRQSIPVKIVGLTLFHDLMPAPLERWEWSLRDAGDALNLLSYSGIDLILSGSSYSNWSVQVENAIFSSCGSISDPRARLHSEVGNTFNIISVYEDGMTTIKEYQVMEDREILKRIFKIPILI